MEDENKDTITIEEDAPANQPARETVTPDKMREMGWTKEEMAAAEKRGMVTLPEDRKKKDEAVAKAAADKAEADKKAAEAGDAGKKPIDSSLPDFEIKDPAKEKVFLDTFGPGTPHRAIYFRMKNERAQRQRAEGERDRLAAELQDRKDEEARRARGDQPAQEVDADGNVIDPEDKPLTMKQLRALQKTEWEARQKQEKELNERSGKVAEALSAQEEYAKSVYPDFETAVKLATDLVNHPEKLTNPLMRSKLSKLVRDLQATAGNADKYNLEDYTASMIAYELGQMHPDYGKTPENNGDQGKGDPKANGGLTPEQMKRIEENAQRRASSASLPTNGGGSRSVAPEDVKVKDYLKMTSEQRYKFKKDHPALHAKLMKG